MILTFNDVLTAAERERMLELIAGAHFVDGRETAGERLAATKFNEQIALNDTAMVPITALVLDALKRHRTFVDAAYPKQLHSLRIARYRSGMQYGAHVDAALMGDAVAWRSDLSLTLFMSAPDTYDGGELALESGSGELRVKLDAGAMVLYPTGQLHRVLPVTRGERLVVVAWIESFVRDGEVRGMLNDLAQLRELLVAPGADARARDLAVKVHANLLRRHAET